MLSKSLNKLAIACTATALALAGCDKASTQKNAPENAQATTAAAVAPPEAALPLAGGAAPASPPAPAAAALPPAPPLRYDSDTGDRYAYLDRAYTASQAFGDAPPDYTYAYEQEQPLIWRSDDGYERVAEQLPDGGLRYYFYQPGAEEPYLVQDPEYSYAYSDGALTVVYDADGNILSDELAQRQVDVAARYLARARALYAASVEEHHEAVAEAAWQQEQERIYADQQHMQEQQDRDAAWHAYHTAHLQSEQAHWAMERYRRAAEASRFAQTISDAVIAARAAQALSDASAEARRYGHNVAASPIAAAPARSTAAAPDHGAPSYSGPGAHPPQSPAQRQSPEPGATSTPPNPATASLNTRASEPVTNRPNNAQAQSKREQERSSGKALAPTMHASVPTKAAVATRASAPVPPHPATTVPEDRVGNSAPHNLPISVPKPATPPKAPAGVTAAAMPPHAAQTDEKPRPSHVRPGPKDGPVTAPNSVSTRPAGSSGAPPSKAVAQSVQVPTHAKPVVDDHKRPHLPEKKKVEATPQ